MEAALCLVGELDLAFSGTDYQEKFKADIEPLKDRLQHFIAENNVKFNGSE